MSTSSKCYFSFRFPGQTFACIFVEEKMYFGVSVHSNYKGMIINLKKINGIVRNNVWSCVVVHQCLQSAVEDAKLATYRVSRVKYSPVLSSIVTCQWLRRRCYSTNIFPAIPVNYPRRLHTSIPTPTGLFVILHST